MAVKLPDTVAPMGKFPAVMAGDVGFPDGESLQKKVDDGSLGGGSAETYIELSQEEYDALPDDDTGKLDGREDRTYDTGHIYKIGVEFGKDGVQIDDSTTSETSVWSSKKTSDEIAKRQENIFKKHILNVRAGEANRYVLLASCKVSNLTLHNEPIVLSGIMGDNTNANKPLFEVSVGFKTYTTYDTIFTGYINKNIFGITDMFVTFDESTNIVYLYLDMCRAWSIASFEITIPQRNAEYYGLTIADVDSDKQSDTFIGTEIARMSTSPNVKILAGLDDTTSSTTSTYSSTKIDKKFAPRHFGTDNKTLWLKLQLGTMTTHEPITVTDQYGGQVKILGMYDLSTYKSVKVIRISYGDWSTHSGTDVSTTTSGDGNYKIRRLFYCPDDNNYYLEIRQYSYISVEGAPDATMVVNLPVETSAMTLIPESQFVSKIELAEKTANRQVKTFDNSGSSTEKWYKLCSAITGGMGCNIKLTASRADSTATVQYFSVLFRDSRYRYTSSYISRERTVYESMLIADYSIYIVADANNDIWVHVPSYGKAIIEVDTRAITIDGTAGTPVADYVYSSFEHQYDGKIDDSATNTTSTWSSSKIASEITSTYLIKDIVAGGDNEKTVSFKIRKEYFSAYYAKRTFLLSANIYSLGFSKPVIGLVEIFRSTTDNYGGYVVNLQDTRYTGVTVTVNGNYLEIVVSFNSYEGSGCTVACSSLSNAPIA